MGYGSFFYVLSSTQLRGLYGGVKAFSLVYPTGCSKGPFPVTVVSPVLASVTFVGVSVASSVCPLSGSVAGFLLADFSVIPMLRRQAGDGGPDLLLVSRVRSVGSGSVSRVAMARPRLGKVPDFSGALWD